MWRTCDGRVAVELRKEFREHNPRQPLQPLAVHVPVPNALRVLVVEQLREEAEERELEEHRAHVTLLGDELKERRNARRHLRGIHALPMSLETTNSPFHKFVQCWYGDIS